MDPDPIQPHPALFIAEVMRNITSFQTSKTDLLSLALTCRAISGPSIDALWAELPSIVPLLLHLPSEPVDVQEVNRRLDSSNTYVALKHSFTDLDRKVFCERARRVVKLVQGSTRLVYALQFIGDSEHGFSPDVLRELCSFSSSQELFPRLQELKWANDDERAIPFLFTVLGPSTASITMSRALLDDSQFSTFMAKCPRLKTFKDTAWGCGRGNPGQARDLDRTATLSRVVCSWSQLESLDWGYLDPPALSHLSGLRSLKKLQAHLSPSVSSLPISPSSFPVLEGLDLSAPQGRNLQFFVKFFSVINSPLVDLHVSADAISGAALSDLIGALPKPERNAKLESVRIGENVWTQHVARNECAVDITVLQPLLLFSNLVSVWIETWSTVDLGNDDLAKMADAWPRLQLLRINMESGWKRSSRVTFRGLRVLLERLPRLRELRVAIDGTHVDDRDRTSVTSDRLVLKRTDFRLDLLDSRIGDDAIEDVAECIADIFWDRDLQYDCFPMAWDFEDTPPDLAEEDALYRPRWRTVQEILVDAEEERTEACVIC